jgi:hypothetical protein
MIAIVLLIIAAILALLSLLGVQNTTKLLSAAVLLVCGALLWGKV